MVANTPIIPEMPTLPASPKLLDRVAARIRVKHYSIRNKGTSTLFLSVQPTKQSGCPFVSMSLGLTETDALAMVASLEGGTLFKSMTTQVDHRLWQDIYHVPCRNEKTAYIKLTMQDGAVVIQFKEK